MFVLSSRMIVFSKNASSCFRIEILENSNGFKNCGWKIENADRKSKFSVKIKYDV